MHHKLEGSIKRRMDVENTRAANLVSEVHKKKSFLAAAITGVLDLQQIPCFCWVTSKTLTQKVREKQEVHIDISNGLFVVVM